ncbi:MAG: hypothetical protein WAM91_11130 [Candidatus Acidiferrales bacterium]
MTRCMDCGAERKADQCPSCGLTSAAAEVMLRRRLVQRTVVFLVGALVFVPASQVFPPLELDVMFIFVGLVFFAALAMAFTIDVLARQRRDVLVLKRIYFGLIPLPWVIAGMLYFNGKFDASAQTRYRAQVVSRFNMSGFLLKSRRLVVNSWREGHTFERVPVDLTDYARFQPGDNVFVAVEPGAFGIPWVLGVYRDDSTHPR